MPNCNVKQNSREHVVCFKHPSISARPEDDTLNTITSIHSNSHHSSDSINEHRTLPPSSYHLPPSHIISDKCRR
jgi:hypothetical protein